MSFNTQILGTVIASVLDYDHLIKVTNDPTVINPNRNAANPSSWIPADGRSIAESELFKLTGKDKAPDLRGQFLRGLNLIYNVGEPTFVVTNADEDDASRIRKAGDSQGDSFRNHAHAATGHINGSVCGSNGSRDADGGDEKYNSDPNFGDHNVVVSVQPFGGSETRPKNVGIYYYIKIN